MSIVRVNGMPHRCYSTRDVFVQRTLNEEPPTTLTNTSSVITNEYITNYVSKDMVKRDWQYLIRHGFNATTYLNGILYTWTYSPGECYLKIRRKALVSGKVQRTSYKVSGQLRRVDNPGTAAGLSWSAADDIAKARFIKRARQVQSSFQGMTFLAEAREAIRMIRGNALGIVAHTNRYFSDVKRLARSIQMRKRGLSRPSVQNRRLAFEQHLRNRYLEYTYGVSPLVSDIQRAAEFLAERSLDRPHKDFRLIQAQGVVKSQDFSNVVTEQYGLQNFYSKWNNSSKATVIYRGVVRAGGDDLGDVNRRLGLDLSQFLPTVWEIIPWSFVVDYVSNVGDIVDAASFNRSTLKWVSRTVILELGRKLEIEAESAADPGIFDQEAWFWLKPTVSWESKSVARDTYTGSLVPDLRFGLGEVSASWRKQLNLAALGRQNKALSSVLRSIFNR